MDKLDPKLYTVAWLAPLEIEARAALHLLDHRHQGRFPLSRGNDYVFQAGDANGHNVIIATLPAGQAYGTGSAASLAGQVKSFFPNLWFGLLVGVAAGLPSSARDIRLGDVLVGVSNGENPGLVAYDLGKETDQNGFQILRSGRVLAETETVVRSAIRNIELKSPYDSEILERYYMHIKDKKHPNGTFSDPGQEKDILYQFEADGTEYLAPREKRPDTERTRVWYGSIGSGEKLMRNARIRDKLRDEYNIMGLEMEAAGAMICLPVGVIRGVCDYGDGHKSKEWQPYAAAMAAAYARAILTEILPERELPRHRSDVQSGMIDVADSSKRASDRYHTTEAKRRWYEAFGNHIMDRNADEPLIVSQPFDEKTKKLLHSLRFEQIGSRVDDIGKAHTKTCTWLPETSAYRDWLDPNKIKDHHGFVWIRGKPGAGKSTLMKFMLTNAQKEMKDKIIISFFFHARGDVLEKSTAGMYRSLLWQLLTRRPDLTRILNSPELLARADKFRDWSLESLKTLFDEAVRQLAQSSLLCFIDALDECDEHQIRDMISFFSQLGDTTTSSGIAFRVCFASRHYPHITISKGLILIIEGQEGHDQDIVRYIDSNLMIDHGVLAEQIRTEVRTKSSGVFMWVVLVVEILQQEYDHGNIDILRQRLGEIPGNLHKLFHDMLIHDDRNKGQLLLCIQWVIFSEALLEPKEVYFAILSGLGRLTASNVNQANIKEADVERFLISSSKGLVEVTKGRSPFVQFIHESVNDFFAKKNKLQELWPNSSHGFEGESHEQLKQCCLDYIKCNSMEENESMSELKQGTLRSTGTKFGIVQAAPFLEYAVENVLIHSNKAEGAGISQRSFLEAFPLIDWIEFSNLLRGVHLTYSASILYILACENLANLIEVHPCKSSGLDVESETYGPPLFAALATGSYEAAWALLKALVPDDETPSSPLHSLCKQYHQDDKEASGFDLDFKFSRKRGLVSQLVEHNERTILAFILSLYEDDDEVDTQGDGKYTPLVYAMMLEDPGEVIKLLIDNGASVDLHDKSGKTALWHAINLVDKRDVIEQLLDNGAKTNCIDKLTGNSALHCVNDLNGDIVDLLLKRGADINAVNNEGQTPLLLAILEDNFSMVKLLHDRNAAVDRADKNGRTALSHATELERKDIYNLLIG
ncbi:hypothetical protein ACHAPJ_007325 [Fusarium lateritium]